MTERDYPFENVLTPDGEYPKGLLPDAELVHYGPEEVKTYVCIQDESGVASGSPVCVLDFLWQPQRGAVIQVGEPNRDFIVEDVLFRFERGGPVQMVYTHEVGA